MKKCILWAVVVLLGVLATTLWLSCRRSSPPTTRQPAAETKQTGASTVPEQTASRISPQAEVKPLPEKPPATPDADIPEADRKDDGLWRRTPEYEAFEAELQRIIAAADTRAYLTSNEVAFVITYMQSPHYYARWKAVIFAAACSDPDKPIVLPYVLSLLSDPVWKVRMWAAYTLGDIGDKGMIPYLEPLLNDRPEVAKAAQRTISKLQQK